MAPRRVIEDSDEDEDEDGFAAPELLSPSVIANEVSSVPMMQPLSTDPILFQAVYEEHFGQMLVDDQHPTHGQSPVFEDPIIGQRMSSSASLPSARKLERSKTVNVSSLSSITEPTLSIRKAKRTDLMRGIDDLTQITTPSKSKDATRNDPWEVPTSSASDRRSDMNAKVKSRNAERKSNLKTYGRQTRRTQTVAHTPCSTPTDQRLLSSPEDDMSQIANQNSFLQNQEEDYLPIPRPKRHKVGPSINVDLSDHDRTEPVVTVLKEAFLVSSGTSSPGVGSMSMQAQRSASDFADMETKIGVAAYTHDFSSLSVTSQTNPDATIVDSNLLTKAAAAQASRKSLSSIVIVPDALSEEQKLQYEIVSVTSTSRSPRSSLLDMPGTNDPNIHHTRDSGTVFNGTPLPEFPPVMVEDGAPAILISFSPPVLAGDRKMKRAKSEVGSKRMPTSAMTSHQNKGFKRKGRSKTIAQGEKTLCREASVDELSLTSPKSVKKRISGEASTKTGAKRAYGEGEEELMSTDELYTFEETGQEEEQYRPRPSLRRSKSISTNASIDDVDLKTSKARVVRKKILKSTDTNNHSTHGDVELSTGSPVQASVMHEASAMATSLSWKGIAAGHVQQTESPIPKRVEDNHNAAMKPADILVVKTVPPIPAQPKKRGRKKTSEIVAAKSNGVSKDQSAALVPVTSKDNEVQRKELGEMDSNKQSSQEIASTPPTNANIATVTGVPPPAQTPTKDSKKGPDQHSPLPNGKVPYRVGLSKKTRIAPLLKMIRK